MVDSNGTGLARSSVALRHQAAQVSCADVGLDRPDVQLLPVFP